MCAVKIGLDFGTHQTKICIEDSSDKRNKRYYFHRFKDLNDSDSLVFPSLVQVNNDHTLSYGFVNTENALKVKGGFIKPIKPKAPVYEQYISIPPLVPPVKPWEEKKSKKKIIITSFSDLKNALISNTSISKEDSLVVYQKELAKYQKDLEQREILIAKNKAIAEKNELKKKRYDDALAEYNISLQKYEESWIPKTYRYFKQTVFSSGEKWEHDISAMLISIWYLTYIFFDLDEKYQTYNLIVHFGTSSGKESWEKNKHKATQIMLTVYDLIERVFEHDKRRFLSSTVEELLCVTKIAKYSDSLKDENAIFVFPEAVANLQPLSKLNAFSDGVHLLVDIGGGTTDISLFSSPKGSSLNIYDYFSLPCGLNSINQSGITHHINNVQQVVSYVIRKIEVYASSLNVSSKEISKITKNRSVVFTGGGSVDNKLCRPYNSFNDVVILKKRFDNLMPSANIERSNKEMHVLSTSLGLAMFDSDDSQIPLHSYSKLFENVAERFSDTDTTNGGEKYEHGLSDY